MIWSQCLLSTILISQEGSPRNDLLHWFFVTSLKTYVQVNVYKLNQEFCNWYTVYIYSTSLVWPLVHVHKTLSWNTSRKWSLPSRYINYHQWYITGNAVIRRQCGKFIKTDMWIWINNLRSSYFGVWNKAIGLCSTEYRRALRCTCTVLKISTNQSKLQYLF